MSYTIGSFAIIFDQQKRVLLCHRGDIDLWNLPGGGMDHGERILDALVDQREPVYRIQTQPSSREWLDRLQQN